MSCPRKCLLMGFDACRAAVRDTTAITVKGQLFCPSKEPTIEPKEEKASNVSTTNRSKNSTNLLRSGWMRP